MDIVTINIVQTQSIFINKLRVISTLLFFIGISSCTSNVEKDSQIPSKKFVAKYYEDGTLKSITEGLSDDSVAHGQRIEYHPNGQIAVEANLIHGRYYGKFKKYNSEGVLIEQLNMDDGRAHGVVRNYYPSGNLQRRGYYSSGFHDGYHIEYYDRNDRLVPKLANFYLAQYYFSIGMEIVKFDSVGNIFDIRHLPFANSHVNAKKIKKGESFIIEIEGDIGSYDSCRYYYIDYPTGEPTIFDSIRCKKEIKELPYINTQVEARADFIGSRVIRGAFEGYRTIVKPDTVYEESSYPILFKVEYSVN